MYPFGSGMPQPQTTTPSSATGYHQHQQQHPHHHQQHAGMPGGVPFGAGWVMPTSGGGAGSGNGGSFGGGGGYPSYSSPQSHSPQQQQQSPSQSHLHYQPLPNQAPYPSHNSYSPQHHLPPTHAQQSHYGGGGAAYPHNSQHNSPYPSAAGASPSSAAPYPSHASSQAHNAHYSHPAAHPSYAPTHGYTPVPTTGGFESPAGNMAHCFEELANLQGHPIQHHHGAPQHHPSQQPMYHHQQHQQQQQHVYIRREGTPTVFPAQNFDPVKDAHDLRKAMKGFGTDEDALINIICRRTNEQRQEIQRQYKTHFGKDLIEDIKSETSGNFEKLLVGLLRPIVDYYCNEMKDAMAGIGTDEDVLIEILCTLSNIEIHTIKNQYLRLYGAHLESELKSETSGNFKRLLVSLCTAARDESGHCDPGAAQNDARELLKAGELRVGTDESMFNMILCQRNYQQLKMIFHEYETMTGHTLEKAIKKEFSGDIMEGLIAIYRCVTNKAEYFASRLHKSMAGIGTNDTQLIRVIITRSEIDMVDIKTAFERVYGKSLKSWIKGDTSGHYKHALYALIGEQRSS